MMNPKALVKGDYISIVSPSSEIQSFPRRIQRGLDSLQACGYQPVLSANALAKKGHDAGSPESRAIDLMTAFTTPSISAIMGSTGGYTSNSVLKHLDYDEISRNPKIIVGFSDITALLLGIYAKTGMPVFHGPTLLPSFGDAAGVHVSTATAFINAVSGLNNINLIVQFDEYSESSLHWDKEDDVPRSFSPDSGPVTIIEGDAEGVLLGGNLDTLLSIISTEYCPSFRDSILFLEEAGGTVSKTLRNLKTLEYHGTFNQIKGLIYGRTYNYNDNNSPNSNLHYYLTELGKAYNIPLIANIPLGHTEPKLTLPIGSTVRLDTTQQTLICAQPFLSL